MTTTTFTALALSCFLSGRALAQEPRVGVPDGGARQPLKELVLQRFDTDHDGQLDATERAAARSALERMQDARGRRGAGARGAEGPALRRGARGSEQSARGQRDARPQREGIAPSLEEVVEHFDRDHDGRLDDSERAALRDAVRERCQGREGRSPRGQQRRAPRF